MITTHLPHHPKNQCIEILGSRYKGEYRKKEERRQEKRVKYPSSSPP
jgi:hypothetical protein